MGFLRLGLLLNRCKSEHTMVVQIGAAQLGDRGLDVGSWLHLGPTPSQGCPDCGNTLPCPCSAPTHLTTPSGKPLCWLNLSFQLPPQACLGQRKCLCQPITSVAGAGMPYSPFATALDCNLMTYRSGSHTF